MTKIKRKGDWIQTYVGKQFWLLDPDPESINMVDITHALAMQCRYNGHTPIFYSVAQHCIFVSDNLKRGGFANELVLWGLLHDASEAYVGDMVRPLKADLPEFKRVEGVIHRMIQKKFLGHLLNEYDERIIKRADLAVFGAEAKLLFPENERVAEWGIPVSADPNIKKIPELSISEVKNTFFNMFYDLTIKE